MGRVEQPLVAGVRVHGGHQPGFDAEAVVQHLGDRRQAVCGAGCVADDVVLLRIVAIAIHAQDDRDVLVARGRRDDHLLGAPAVDMHFGLRRISEEAGRLDHDLDAEVAPGQAARILLGKYFDAGAVDL